MNFNSFDEMPTDKINIVCVCAFENDGQRDYLHTNSHHQVEMEKQSDQQSRNERRKKKQPNEDSKNPFLSCNMMQCSFFFLPYSSSSYIFALFIVQFRFQSGRDQICVYDYMTRLNCDLCVWSAFAFESIYGHSFTMHKNKAIKNMAYHIICFSFSDEPNKLWKERKK